MALERVELSELGVGPLAGVCSLRKALFKETGLNVGFLTEDFLSRGLEPSAFVGETLPGREPGAPIDSVSTFKPESAEPIPFM